MSSKKPSHVFSFSVVVPVPVRIPMAFLLMVCMGCLLLSGCSTFKRREKRAELRELFVKGDHQGGLKVLNSEILKKDEDSRLLYFLEKGILHHAAGEYYLSLMALERAKELSQQLYTKSISKKVMSGVVNDTMDIYYGENFERSLIHFYLSLNHFLLWQKGEIEAHSPQDLDPFAPASKEEGKVNLIPARTLTPQERQKELMSARSELLAWDSMLESSKDERRGKSVFKDDLLAKIYGGFIHEAIQNFQDDQTALQLYQDAKELLFKNYNAYQTFNQKSVQFKKDFSRLPELGIDKVREEYVQSTAFQDELVSFLDFKILHLTKKIRPQGLKQMIKQLQPNPAIVERVEKANGRENVGVLVQWGMVPEKIADKYNFGLEGAMRQAGDEKTRAAIAQVGVPLIATFAAEILGLVPPAQNWSVPGAMLGVTMAQAAVSTVGISFELPKVLNVPTQEKGIVEAFDQSGQKVAESPLVLLSPLGDIAEEAVAEHSAWAYTRVGTRLALKHITAILASYGTYKMMTGKGDQMSSFMAKNVALLQYMAASKAIEASEVADTRFWSTLPKDIRMAQLHLPSGEYQLKVRMENGQSARTFELGMVKVNGLEDRKLVNFRVKNQDI